ncbi:MAG: DUF1289 domain-containing protein [Gammaproteobacteria bacterium]|nr:DUF1289 domain-containing protein [Gammaproteobacteria bacterium]
MKATNSPCINVCEFIGPNRWCSGCGRTRAECQSWDKMKPYAKQALQKALKKRLSQINADKK